jgi:myo-inositol 2-dehydrogenase / D-chiro-inositol 1-dehydrogenase
MSDLKTVRIGLAGLGRLGKHHAENLIRATPGASLVAVCSPVREERDWARSVLGVERCHEDYAALLAQPDVDTVWLVTPTSLHADQIVAALEAGKHVFCEKPLSLDPEECRRVVRVAERLPHLKVMIGFVRRFDASYRDAHAQIRAGTIGQPFLVRSQTGDRYDPDGFFVRFAATSGGIFLDCSVHDIDLARWMLGNPRAVRTYATGTNACHPELEAFGDVDNGLAICEFEGGRLAVFYASRTLAYGHDTTTEVIGTGGSLWVGRNPRANRLEIGGADGIRTVCTSTFYDRFEEAFRAEARAFVDAVRHDTDVPVSLADALEATRIGIALRTSLQTRQPVDLA